MLTKETSHYDLNCVINFMRLLRQFAKARALRCRNDKRWVKKERKLKYKKTEILNQQTILYFLYRL